MSLYELTIHEAHNLLKQKQITSKELTQSVFDRIDTIDKDIHAYITKLYDRAIMQACEADEVIAKGQISPLTGIPLSIKDLICTKGIRTTCASKILESFVPVINATVMEKLNTKHSVMTGKVNMDEFAMGSTTEHSAFAKNPISKDDEPLITRNPWNRDYIPGGSSGGSAASVSSDMCIASLGSDTGGSIRQPASHCSVVGLKPTYGRVSRFGLVAFASSLDQIGPITKDVTDSAILLNAISGHDPNDSTSSKEPVPDYTATLKNSIKGMTIGIPKEYQKDTQGIDPDVLSAFHHAIERYKSLGVKFNYDISLPHAEYVVAVYYIIAPAEASSNLARYDGVKYGFRSDNQDLMDMYRQTRTTGFGKEVQRRIIIGTYALSSGYYDAYYKKASQVRTLLIQDFKQAFQSCQAILSPVSPTPPFKIGSKVEDPLTLYLTDIFTLSANLAGIPGISIPCGFSKDNLPIGLQLMGNYFDEATILNAAYQFEQATEFHKKKPVL